jgi:uncharacterized membrane protein YkoI
MVPARPLLIAGFLAGLLVVLMAPAIAGEHGRCLSPDERRAKIASHAVIPLAKAIRAVKVRRAEVVRANLCERGGRLVYLLTVLPRDGRVVRATVDASTGAVNGR